MPKTTLGTFSEREYQDQAFQGLTFEDTDGSKLRLTDCTFKDCTLTRVRLLNADLCDVTFDHCELTLTDVAACAFRSVTFHQCKLVGVDFSKASPHLLALRFEDCLIDTGNFSTLKLAQTAFPRCTIRDTRFVETDLTGADFSHADLEGSLFHQCDLRKATFDRARNYAVDPLNNRVAGATFCLPEAICLLNGLGIKLS